MITFLSLLIYNFLGSEEKIFAICNSIKEFVYARCGSYGPIHARNIDSYLSENRLGGPFQKDLVYIRSYSLYFLLGLILLIILLIYFKRERKPESMYEEERTNQNSNHRIILCPDCSQKIRFSVPLTTEIIKCQKCDAILSVRVGEDGHVYITSQDKKQNDHNERESETLTLVDYFGVLGLSIEAAPDEVKSAFKKKIKEYHPDKVARLGEKLRVIAEKESKKINVISCAKLFSDVMHNVNNNQSINPFFIK